MADFGPQPYRGVKAVEKSLRILELLLEAQEGLTVAQIAARTEMHRASAHRLLASLRTMGWVERDLARPTFRISLRLYALVHVFVQNFGLLDRLKPLLKELSMQARETVHLGILDGHQVLHIGRQECPERVGVMSPIGSRGWAHTSGLGKALLAGQSDDFLRTYIVETGLPGMTEHSITAPEAFWAEIASIRRQHVSIDNEEDSIGVRCLGTTLPSAQGRAVLAISISGPSPRFTLDHAYAFAPVLLDCIRRMHAPDDAPSAVAVAVAAAS